MASSPIHICGDGNLVEHSKVERTPRFGGGSLPFVGVTLVICSFYLFAFVFFFVVVDVVFPYSSLLYVAR